jgi:alkylation response protein AidB-like acyl-CoA dehydrogenase
MSSMLKRSLLVAGAVLAVGQGVARASDFDNLTVNVPFQFVVENRLMPAGKYMLQRDDQDRSLMLIRAENGKRVGSFVLTYPAGGRDPKGDKPCLSFTRVGNKYELTSIWESRDDGMTVIEKKGAEVLAAD